MSSQPARRRARATALSLAAFVAAALMLSGCAKYFLPQQVESKSSPFEDYAAAIAFYEGIHPFVTTTEELSHIGVTPQRTPNLHVMNYLEIMQLFMKQDTVRLRDLDPPVQACLNARNACEGWVMTPERIERQRVGDVSLDVLGFERDTVSTGWKAEMVFLMMDGVVVYKLWSGTPKIRERKTETKPLGPLQDLSGAAAGAARDAVGQ